MPVNIPRSPFMRSKSQLPASLEAGWKTENRTGGAASGYTLSWSLEYPTTPIISRMNA